MGHSGEVEHEGEPFPTAVGIEDDPLLRFARVQHRASQVAGDARAILNGFSKPNKRKVRAMRNALASAVEDLTFILEVQTNRRDSNAAQQEQDQSMRTKKDDATRPKDGA